MVATLVTPARQPIGRIEILTPDRWIPDELKYRMHDWQPASRLGQIVKECLRYLPPELAGEVIERITSCILLESQLEVVVVRHPDSPFRQGRSLVEDYGVVSRKKVTTEGVTQMCVNWASATFDMKYMALATTSTAEANTDTVANRFDTASEIAAANYSGGVRPTCTHVESSNTVPLVGVHTQTTTTNNIEAHGITNSATRSAGQLWDRSLTGTIALAVSDTLTGTYTLTASAEA